MNRYDPQKPNQGMRMTKAMKKAKGGDVSCSRQISIP